MNSSCVLVLVILVSVTVSCDGKIGQEGNHGDDHNNNHGHDGHTPSKQGYNKLKDSSAASEVSKNQPESPLTVASKPKIDKLKGSSSTSTSFSNKKEIQITVAKKPGNSNSRDSSATSTSSSNNKNSNSKDSSATSTGSSSKKEIQITGAKKPGNSNSVVVPEVAAAVPDLGIKLNNLLPQNPNNQIQKLPPGLISVQVSAPEPAPVPAKVPAPVPVKVLVPVPAIVPAPVPAITSTNIVCAPAPENFALTLGEHTMDGDYNPGAKTSADCAKACSQNDKCTGADFNVKFSLCFHHNRLTACKAFEEHPDVCNYRRHSACSSVPTTPIRRTLKAILTARVEA